MKIYRNKESKGIAYEHPTRPYELVPFAETIIKPSTLNEVIVEPRNYSSVDLKEEYELILTIKKRIKQ